MARRLAHWLPSPMGTTSLPARRKAGSYGLLSLLDGKSGNAHIAIGRKSRENASGRESGRRRRSNQMLFCNGGDRVKVRQGRLKRTEDQQVSQRKQMTEEVMGPCSPAKRGPHTTGCAVLRLVRSGMGVPLACSLPVAELNWKAGCVERHLSGLERGKGCEALPIVTFRQDHNDRPIVLKSQEQTFLTSCLHKAEQLTLNLLQRYGSILAIVPDKAQ